MTEKNEAATQEAIVQPEQRERTLINLMNQLNEEGREKIEDYIEVLISSGNYQKNMVSLKWARKKRKICRERSSLL